MNTKLYTYYRRFGFERWIPKKMHNCLNTSYSCEQLSTMKLQHKHCKSTQSGYAYEDTLHSYLNSVFYNHDSSKCIPFLVDSVHAQGGSSSNPDIAFQYIDKYGNIQKSNIEIKTRFDGTDWGQFQMVYQDEMYCPKHTLNQDTQTFCIAQKYANILNTHKQSISLQLPSSNLTLEQWHNYKNKCQEKANGEPGGHDPTQDVYIPVHSNDILEYYGSKNNSYVQVKDYGLYHLGEDVCDFGVPQLALTDVELRFRIKNHGARKDKTQIFSLTAALRIKKKPAKSNVSLDDVQYFPEQLIMQKNDFMKIKT